MRDAILGAVLGFALLGGSVAGVHRRSDGGRASQHGSCRSKPQVLIADDAEVAYCTPQFKKVLQRVLHACGLVGASRRGCQPADVKRSPRSTTTISTPSSRRSRIAAG